MTEYYVTKIDNDYAKKAVECANEVITLYFSSSELEKFKSLQRTKQFFDNLNMYLFGTTTFDHPGEKDSDNTLKNRFLSKVRNAGNIKWLEYNLAYQRLKFSTGVIPEYVINHNAQFVNWILYETGIIEEKCQALGDISRNFLQNANHFDRSKMDTLEGRAKLFLRNAYRVERYSKRQEDGTYDMYVPLILSRMALEQYLKANYEDKIGGDATSLTPSFCRQELLKANLISKAFANEVLIVLQRGNLNTHEGHATYPFATIHGIEVLRECAKYFENKK